MSGRAESKPSLWLTVLLAVGVLLTLLTLLALVTSPPHGLRVTALALSPWGPIALVAWALLARHQRRVSRLRQVGRSARATVVSIHTTGSVINGRPVLRLELTVEGKPDYAAAVRTAPPSHLVSMLRPTVSLPVKVDPDRPERLMVDWPQAERETSPGHGRPPELAG